MMTKIKVAPSILTADFAALGQEAARLEQAGADYLHLDIMDGHFVPNISFGPAVVAGLRQVTRLPFDVHLMLARPDRYLAAFAEAGAGIITVHAEACPHLHRTLTAIRELGVKAGVAINPATPPEAIYYILEQVDLVLLMTVNPGFGGQSYLELVEPKIARVRGWLDERGLAAELEVDGGINPATAGRAVAAGARVLVAGAAVFRAADMAAAISAIRQAGG